MRRLQGLLRGIASRKIDESLAREGAVPRSQGERVQLPHPIQCRRSCTLDYLAHCYLVARLRIVLRFEFE